MENGDECTEVKARQARDETDKTEFFLHIDVDSWDPASEGGDETKISQLRIFLEHHAIRTRPQTVTLLLHTIKPMSKSAMEFLLLVSWVLMYHCTLQRLGAADPLHCH